MQEKVAIVTGAGRGIGRAIAVRLAQEGAKVVVNYSRSADAATEVVALISEAGGEALAVQGDVAHADQVNALLRRYAGTFRERGHSYQQCGHHAGQTDPAHDRRRLGRRPGHQFEGRVFVRQSGRAANAEAKKRRDRQCRLRLGKVGGAGQANYSASKAGLVGLSKSLAKELGSRNIRVNAVAPGFIETDMTQVLKEEQRESVVKLIPLGRLGAGEDVANVVTFLCTDDAAYIQGEVISVDGGLFM